MKNLEKELKKYELLINLGVNVECSDEYLKDCEYIVKNVLLYIEMEKERRLLCKK